MLLCLHFHIIILLSHQLILLCLLMPPVAFAVPETRTCCHHLLLLFVAVAACYCCPSLWPVITICHCSCCALQLPATATHCWPPSLLLVLLPIADAVAATFAAAAITTFADANVCYSHVLLQPCIVTAIQLPSLIAAPILHCFRHHFC